MNENNLPTRNAFAALMSLEEETPFGTSIPETQRENKEEQEIGSSSMAQKELGYQLKSCQQHHPKQVKEQI